MEVKFAARLSFAKDLWVPKQYQGQGAFKYSCTVMFEKDGPDDKKVRAVIDTVMKEKFKDKAPAIRKLIWGNTKQCATWTCRASTLKARSTRASRGCPRSPPPTRCAR